MCEVTAEEAVCICNYIRWCTQLLIVYQQPLYHRLKLHNILSEVIQQRREEDYDLETITRNDALQGISQRSDQWELYVFRYFIENLMELQKQLDMPYHTYRFLRDHLLTAAYLPEIYE